MIGKGASSIASKFKITKEKPGDEDPAQYHQLDTNNLISHTKGGEQIESQHQRVWTKDGAIIVNKNKIKATPVSDDNEQGLSPNNDLIDMDEEILDKNPNNSQPKDFMAMDDQL